MAITSKRFFHCISRQKENQAQAKFLQKYFKKLLDNLKYI